MRRRRIFPFSWYWPNWLIGDFMNEMGLLDCLIVTAGIIGIAVFWALVLMCAGG